MKLADETITVFNSRLDDFVGYDVYIPSVIRGVSWYDHVESAVTNDGLKAANKITIRIPVDADFDGKSYVDPGGYATADPSTSFTLKQGDIIVKGEEHSPLTPAQAVEKYGMVATILGVTDNRRAPNAKHWKVVGK